MPRQWNLGFATEAAIACRNFGFINVDRTHLVSLIDPENDASKRVAEKVGMSPEKKSDRWGKRVQVYGIAIRVSKGLLRNAVRMEGLFWVCKGRCLVSQCEGCSEYLIADAVYARR